MIFNPRYGVAGMFAMPFYAVFEMAGPFIEVLGYGLFLTHVLLGRVDYPFAVTFFFVAVFYGTFVSLLAILLEELSSHRYPRPRDILILTAAGVAENLFYRQYLAVVRAWSILDYLQRQERVGGHGETRFRQSGANAMSADRRRFVSVIAGLGLTIIAAGGGFAQGRDEIRQALLSGAHDKAVALALEALRSDPSNAEIRFLLARAYAYSGKRDEAEAVAGARFSRSTRPTRTFSSSRPVFCAGARTSTAPNGPSGGPWSSSRARPTPWPVWPTWPRGRAIATRRSSIAAGPSTSTPTTPGPSSASAPSCSGRGTTAGREAIWPGPSSSSP